MRDGERQLLGAVVLCGMLIGALLATRPRDTPAAGTPSSPICSVAEGPAMALENTSRLQPADWSCREKRTP
jgi:hypothetical protein